MSRSIDTDRQRLIAQSLINSLSLLMATATGSGERYTALDAMRHLFDADELAEIEDSRHEAEAMDNSLKVLNRIRTIQAGWDHGGH